MFYVFANDGVYIINPETSSTVNHIQADDVINGTVSAICTSGRQRTCNWGGAVKVNLKHIYAADFLGKRVLVLDVVAQKFVLEIAIDDYPYQLKYFRCVHLISLKQLFTCIRYSTGKSIAILCGIFPHSMIVNMQTCIIHKVNLTELLF